MLSGMPLMAWSRGVNGSRAALIESGRINRRRARVQQLFSTPHSPSCCCEMFHACSPARLTTTTAFSMTSFCALQRTALQHTRGDLIKSILLKATFRNDLRNTSRSPHSETMRGIHHHAFCIFYAPPSRLCVMHTFRLKINWRWQLRFENKYVTASFL